MLPLLSESPHSLDGCYPAEKPIFFCIFFLVKPNGYHKNLKKNNKHGRHFWKAKIQVRSRHFVVNGKSHLVRLPPNPLEKKKIGISYYLEIAFGRFEFKRTGSFIIWKIIFSIKNKYQFNFMLFSNNGIREVWILGGFFFFPPKRQCIPKNKIIIIF